MSYKQWKKDTTKTIDDKSTNVEEKKNEENTENSEDK